MKTLFTLFALLAFIGISTAQNALRFNSGPITLLSASTNASTGNFPGNGYSNYTTVIDCTKASVIALEASLNLTNSGITNIVIWFRGSLDGSNFESIGSSSGSNTIKWPITPNGTTAIRAFTNINVGSMPYYRYDITNGNDAAITNFTLRYNFKR